MTPSDALILRSQMVEGLARTLRRSAAVAIPERVRQAGSVELLNLTTASLFTWRHDLLLAAFSAAASLPRPISLTPDLAPSPHGLYLFEKCVQMQGSSRAIDGIGWHSLATDYTMIFLYVRTANTTWSHHGPFSAWANFVLKNGADITSTLESLDERQRQKNDDFDVTVGHDAAVSFLIASWLWLKQTVMSCSIGVTSASARKQAKRAAVHIADVNVVSLRKREGAHSNEHESTGEWSCQWLVRGHWRQQFYSATQTHRPLWIEPYVKGPEDKPLKVPAQTVYQVSR